MHLHFPVLDAALQEGEAAGVVVGRDHHQGVAVFLGPLQNSANHFVKVEEFLAHVPHFILVGPVINLGAFHHEEEAFLVIQHLKGFQGAFHEDGAAVQRGLEVVFVVQAQEFVAFCIGNVFQLVHVGIALGFHLFNEVAAVGALVPEMGAAAGNEVHVGVNILGRQAFLVLPGGAVDAEVRRGSVVDAAGNGHARLLAFDALGPLQVGLHFLSVRAQADIAVLGLFAVGQGGSAGAGVRDEFVRSIGAGIAHIRHLVNVQGTAVGYPAHAPLRQAGAVANHEDDVFHLLALGLFDMHRLVRGFHLVFIVLGEGVGGILGAVPVQIFRILGKRPGAQEQCSGGKHQFFHRFHPSRVRVSSFCAQRTVRLSPGAREKKLSLQRGPAMSCPLASFAFRIS